MIKPRSISEEIEWLHKHRLMPAVDLLVSRRLVSERIADIVVPLVRRQRAEMEARHALEEEVIGEFKRAGILAICLKGAALARWLYPEAVQRFRMDLDLIVKREYWEAASELLTSLGFRAPRYTVWATQGLFAHRANRLIVDLHRQLSDHPVFHHLFEFDELWQSSVPLIGHEPTVCRLDAPHALVHAIIHHSVEAGSGETADARLLDMLLIWEYFDRKDREMFASICRQRGLSGLAAAALAETSRKFAWPMPSEEADLRAQGTSESLTTLVTRPRTRAHMAMMAWRSQPNLRARISLLRRFVFPDPQFMREREPADGHSSLAMRYAKRMLPKFPRSRKS